MRGVASKIRRFLASEDGLAAVEYAVMAAWRIAVSIAIITTFGYSANARISSVSTVHFPRCPMRCVNSGCDVGHDCCQSKTLHGDRARQRTGSAVPPAVASGQVAVK
jgi:Flp pilus assembly pilin Flp